MVKAVKSLAQLNRRCSPMNILVCDDDEIFVQQLTKEINYYCASWSIDVTVSPFVRPTQIDSSIQYDIAFLDIDMKEITGISLARTLRQRIPNIVIIFVTNFVQYAPEGYEVSAFRYLLKNNVQEKLSSYLKLAFEQVFKSQQIVTISISSEDVDVPIQNILYLESNRRIITIHLINTTRDQYQFYGNMTNLSEKFKVLGFLRIQKSFLVNMNYIELFQFVRVQLKNGQVLSSSKKNHAEIKKVYLQWRGKNKWSIC